MKKVVLSVLLFIALNSSAQLGIVTLDKKELAYYGQWYVINSKEFKDHLLYYDKTEIVDALLLTILEPWDLARIDAEKDEVGDLYWFVDNDNGFNATIYLIKMDEHDSQIVIVTSENE
jgi:hypothetical protein